jgi:hypothetical protein
MTHLPSLTRLLISSCQNTTEFLQELAKVLNASDSSGVKTFRLMQTIAEAELVDAVEALIENASGLESLFVSTPGAQRVTPEKVCRHGETLRFLHLDFHNDWDDDDFLNGEENRSDHYTTSELAMLVDGCPHVEELGVHVAVIPFNDWKQGTPISVSAHETLANALDIISRLPLRNLRFTHSLADEEDYGQADEGDQARYSCRRKDIARSIMQFLADAGSHIELMVFSPSGRSYAAVADYNGHVWPHYYYVRGTSTVRYRGQDRIKVDAVPVPFEELTDYVCEPEILPEGWPRLGE